MSFAAQPRHLPEKHRHILSAYGLSLETCLQKGLVASQRLLGASCALWQHGLRPVGRR